MTECYYYCIVNSLCLLYICWLDFEFNTSLILPRYILCRFYLPKSQIRSLWFKYASSHNIFLSLSNTLCQML